MGMCVLFSFSRMPGTSLGADNYKFGESALPIREGFWGSRKLGSTLESYSGNSELSKS